MKSTIYNRNYTSNAVVCFVVELLFFWGGFFCVFCLFVVVVVVVVVVCVCVRVCVCVLIGGFVVVLI